MLILATKSIIPKLSSININQDQYRFLHLLNYTPISWRVSTRVSALMNADSTGNF